MIYYIYKVRRKQTSIRFSRSALPYRYLRYISWISWNTHRPPQAGFFHLVPQSAHTLFSRRSLYPKAAIAAALSLLPPGGQANALRSFPEKKKTTFLPLFRAPLSRRSSYAALPSVPRTCRPRPVCRPLPASSSAAFPQTKNAGPQHCAANPLATFVKRAQKSVDFSLKKAHVGTPGLHALASAAFIDGPHSLLSFFLSPFLQRKRKKQKQIQQVRIHRSDSLRSSSRCTRLARRASSAEIYVAIATRFVRDCVEDLAPLVASMERISKCSWHIKDHYLGVIKASRIFLLLLRFLFSQNLSPKKFDFSQKI